MKTQREIADVIHARLLDKEEEMLQFLKELVQIETPSSLPAAQTAIFKLLQKKFTELDFYSLQVPGRETGGYLYARPAKREKKLPLQLIVGHCDTVWPIQTLKMMPVGRHDNQFKGPGVYDMKVGLTQLFFAIRIIRELGLPWSVTPVIIINSDEEIGSIESTGIIKKLAHLSVRAYVLEPPLGLDGKLKTARKGVGRFTITVKGKAAHAGLDPGKGISAIVELSHQVQKLYSMNDFEKGITVNVGMIEGGISPNVIAPESKAVVDVRVLNEKDGAYITKKIKELTPAMEDVTLTVEGGIGRPPMEKTPGNERLWQTALEKARLLGITLEDATAGGGSDANTTSTVVPTLDGLGTPGDGAHANHEYILYKKLPERTALLTLLLLADVKT
ncbi:M20 family metallopeptidase [Ascidiimonas aurantiaca]|uniref:M20 family metallopeptidase n=1 Tax=Ascidiimonas aurantiaca TaxID=1685432 RepID=UPI0030EE2E52